MNLTGFCHKQAIRWNPQKSAIVCVGPLWPVASLWQILIFVRGNARHLRKQWSQKFEEKFFPLPMLLKAKSYNKLTKSRKHFDTLGVDYDVVTSLAEMAF